MCSSIQIKKPAQAVTTQQILPNRHLSRPLTVSFSGSPHEIGQVDLQRSPNTKGQERQSQYALSLQRADNLKSHLQIIVQVSDHDNLSASGFKPNALIASR